jgi:hypothetical protein
MWSNCFKTPNCHSTLVFGDKLCGVQGATTRPQPQGHYPATDRTHLAAVVHDRHLLHISRLVVVERLQRLDVPELRPERDERPLQRDRTTHRQVRPVHKTQRVGICVSSAQPRSCSAGCDVNAGREFYATRKDGRNVAPRRGSRDYTTFISRTKPRAPQNHKTPHREMRNVARAIPGPCRRPRWRAGPSPRACAPLPSCGAPQAPSAPQCPPWSCTEIGPVFGGPMHKEHVLRPKASHCLAKDYPDSSKGGGREGDKRLCISSQVSMH